MDTQGILEGMNEIKQKIGQEQAKKWNLPTIERIVKRLDTYSEECDECKVFLNDFAILIDEMRKREVPVYDKRLSVRIKNTTAHLQKKHQLVAEGYYMNTYMAYGIALGLPFGVIFSQLIGQMAYVGIGLPIGLAIGLSIGSGLDAKAKKEGLVI